MSRLLRERYGIRCNRDDYYDLCFDAELLERRVEDLRKHGIIDSEIEARAKSTRKSADDLFEKHKHYIVRADGTSSWLGDMDGFW